MGIKKILSSLLKIPVNLFNKILGLDIDAIATELHRVTGGAEKALPIVKIIASYTPGEFDDNAVELIEKFIHPEVRERLTSNFLDLRKLLLQITNYPSGGVMANGLKQEIAKEKRQNAMRLLRLQLEAEAREKGKVLFMGREYEATTVGMIPDSDIAAAIEFAVTLMKAAQKNEKP